jgi:SAM-dependent methyltransferase
VDSKLPFTLQPDSQTLWLTPTSRRGYAEARNLRERFEDQQPILIRPDMLPFREAQFDVINATGAPFGMDLYTFARSCEHALKPGGWLTLYDRTVPEDPRAARYVNALYQFRNPTEQTHYAEYEWRGVFLDVGLRIEKCEVSQGEREPVFYEELNLSEYQIERLHILLHQAPKAVQKFLELWAIGSNDALFRTPGIIIYGQKPA